LIEEAASTESWGLQDSALGVAVDDLPADDHSADVEPMAARAPKRLRSLLIYSTVAVALGVLLVVGLGSRSGNGRSGPVVPIGNEAPNFSLPPLTGAVQVDLDALGKAGHHPVVLNFFASWCTPCQRETPLLARAAAVEQAKDGPVRFVGVDVNDQPTDALLFVRKAGITYPVGVDQSFRVTSGLYGLNGLPQTFFLDSEGRVIGHTMGAVNAADLQRWITRMSRVAG